jgi:ribosomal protein L37AE/L43A
MPWRRILVMGRDDVAGQTEHLTFEVPDVLEEESEHHLHCPACGSAAVEGVRTGIQTNVFCDHCAACWHGHAGNLQRVNPTTCGPGCEHLDRCMVAFAKDARRLSGPPRAAFLDDPATDG